MTNCRGPRIPSLKSGACWGLLGGNPMHPAVESASGRRPGRTSLINYPSLASRLARLGLPFFRLPLLFSWKDCDSVAPRFAGACPGQNLLAWCGRGKSIDLWVGESGGGRMGSHPSPSLLRPFGLGPPGPGQKAALQLPGNSRRYNPANMPWDWQMGSWQMRSHMGAGLEISGSPSRLDGTHRLAHRGVVQPEMIRDLLGRPAHRAEDRVERCPAAGLRLDTPVYGW